MLPISLHSSKILEKFFFLKHTIISFPFFYNQSQITARKILNSSAPTRPFIRAYSFNLIYLPISSLQSFKNYYSQDIPGVSHLWNHVFSLPGKRSLFPIILAFARFLTILQKLSTFQTSDHHLPRLLGVPFFADLH